MGKKEEKVGISNSGGGRAGGGSSGTGATSSSKSMSQSDDEFLGNILGWTQDDARDTTPADHQNSKEQHEDAIKDQQTIDDQTESYNPVNNDGDGTVVGSQDHNSLLGEIFPSNTCLEEEKLVSTTTRRRRVPPSLDEEDENDDTGTLKTSYSVTSPPSPCKPGSRGRSHYSVTSPSTSSATTQETLTIESKSRGRSRSRSTTQPPPSSNHEEAATSAARSRSATPPPPPTTLSRRNILLPVSQPGAFAIATRHDNDGNATDDDDRSITFQSVNEQQEIPSSAVDDETTEVVTANVFAGNDSHVPIEAMLVNEELLLRREQTLKLRELALRQQLDALHQARSNYLQGQVIVEAVALESSSSATNDENHSSYSQNDDNIMRGIRERIRQKMGENLYGRDKELEVFRVKLEQLKTLDEANQKQLILVSGPSGSGKSSLVMHALSQEQQHGSRPCNPEYFVVRGKFDHQSHTQPYAGVAAAYDDMCDKLISMQTEDPPMYQSLHGTLTDELGLSQLRLLQKVVPKIGSIIDNCTDASNGNVAAMRSDQPGVSQYYTSPPSDVDKNRLNFCFGRFIRIINRLIEKPLVILWDDLQFADSASLDVMDVLLTYQGDEAPLLIVGIYRSDEVEDQLSIHLSHWKQMGRESPHETVTDSNDDTRFPFDFTEVEVPDLTLHALNQLIQDIFCGDCGITDRDGSESNSPVKLACVVLEKTNGNAFFVSQLLHILVEKGFIRLHPGTRRLVWDAAEIRTNFPLSENVVQLLRAKMMKLALHEPWIVRILQIAASLGSNFDVKFLNAIWNQFADVQATSGRTQASLRNALCILEEEGYLLSETMRPMDDDTLQPVLRYSWVHDKIQEAALSLIPKEELSKFNSKIGNILLNEFDEDELDAAVFLVTRYLNGDPTLTGPTESGYTDTDNLSKKKISLAKLNCRAGQKAISISAFESAREFAKSGIALLESGQDETSTIWKDEYDATLQLYCMGARAEGFIGNVETMERYCNEVLRHAKLEDKFDIHNTRIDSLMNRSMQKEAVELMVNLLKQFNCRFAKNPAAIGVCIVRDIMKVKSGTKSLNVATTKTMKESTTMEIMKLLDKLATCMFHAKDDRLPLAVLRSYKYSMKYGFSEFSPPSFAATGIILTGVLNDIQAGRQYSEYALEMLEKSSTSTTESRTLSLTCGMSLTYTKPTKSLLEPLLRGHEVGLQAGDIESAMYCVIMALMIKYELSFPLQELESDARRYCNMMTNLNCDPQLACMKLMRQGYLNLLGRDNADDPTCMVGNSVSESEYDDFQTQDVPAFSIWNWKTVFMTYFGDYVAHAELILQNGHDYHSKNFPADNFGPYTCFIQGLSCFAASRLSGRQKFFRTGRIQHSKIKKWLTMGNPNVKHYDSILEAEFLASTCPRKGGKKYMVIKQYEVAILHAESVGDGFRHDAAIACERLADFYLTVVRDSDQAATYLEKSVKHWQAWGAQSKVNHIRKLHAGLLDGNH